MSRRFLTTAAVAVTALGVGIPLAAPAAEARRTTAAVAGGQTVLTVDRRAAEVFAGNRITIAPIRPARADGRSVSFAVAPKSSRLDPATYGGALDHTGGLRFTARRTSVRLTKLRLSLGLQPALSAVVNGSSRVTLFRLDATNTTVVRDGFDAQVTNVVARLTRIGARTLNRRLGVTRFTAGFRLGRIASQASFTEVAIIGGATNLTFNAALLEIFASQGAPLGVVAPATLANGTVTLPIVSGSVDAATLMGSVRHAGGLSLAVGDTPYPLTELHVTPGVLAASVSGAPPAPILVLNTAAAKITVTVRTLTLTNVVVRTNAAPPPSLAPVLSLLGLPTDGSVGTLAMTMKGR